MCKEDTFLEAQLRRDIENAHNAEMYYRGVQAKSPSAYPFLDGIIKDLMETTIAREDALKKLQAAKGKDF